MTGNKNDLRERTNETIAILVTIVTKVKKRIGT